MTHPIKICLFDVNETLIDLSPLQTNFTNIFGDNESHSLWFEHALHTSLTLSLLNQYQPFDQILRASFQALLDRRKIKLSSDANLLFFQTLKELKIHDDVIPALKLIHQSGIRIFALSNSSKESVEERLKYNHCLTYFENIFSTDSVKSYKPTPISYLFALKELQILPEEACMVAAHDWDTAGAQAVGLCSALIKRPGLIYNSIYLKAIFELNQLTDLAKSLKI